MPSSLHRASFRALFAVHKEYKTISCRLFISEIIDALAGTDVRELALSAFCNYRRNYALDAQKRVLEGIHTASEGDADVIRRAKA